MGLFWTLGYRTAQTAHCAVVRTVDTILLLTEINKKNRQKRRYITQQLFNSMGGGGIPLN